MIKKIEHEYGGKLIKMAKNSVNYRQKQEKKFKKMTKNQQICWYVTQN